MKHEPTRFYREINAKGKIVRTTTDANKALEWVAVWKESPKQYKGYTILTGLVTWEELGKQV